MIYDYDKITNRIHPGWMPFFEKHKDELILILNKLTGLSEVQTIYPRKKDIFRAFYYHSPKDIKLTIIAQDPYINEENNTPQAMGLCFSVPKKHKLIPPSLQNIRKEIKNNYPDYNMPSHGLLKKWAKREKILLLNSSLTVCKGKSNSHAYIWTDFIDKLIDWFDKNTDSVYLLMGGFAKAKGIFINHKIFTTAHPSPLSAYNGFFNSNIFRKINDYFEGQDMKTIKW